MTTNMRKDKNNVQTDIENIMSNEQDVKRNSERKQNKRKKRLPYRVRRDGEGGCSGNLWVAAPTTILGRARSRSGSRSPLEDLYDYAPEELPEHLRLNTCSLGGCSHTLEYVCQLFSFLWLMQSKMKSRIGNLVVIMCGATPYCPAHPAPPNKNPSQRTLHRTTAKPNRARG